jgi:hypothetical protein
LYADDTRPVPPVPLPSHFLQSIGAAQWYRGSSAADISSATQRLLASAGDFCELQAPSPSNEVASLLPAPHAPRCHLPQDPSLAASMERLRSWLAALVRGRRSSFSILANALTPDAKLAAIQTLALQAVQATKNEAVQRAAAACLRRIDVAGVHTCTSPPSQCECSCFLASWFPRFTLPAVHSLECRFRPVACRHIGCSSVHSAIHDDEHRDTCQWTPLTCVLCALPVAACNMQNHAHNECQQRPVRCFFSCCDVTFPLSMRVQ